MTEGRAGMTEGGAGNGDMTGGRFTRELWIPAFAGMTFWQADGIGFV